MDFTLLQPVPKKNFKNLFFALTMRTYRTILVVYNKNNGLRAYLWFFKGERWMF
jgi:hypothetical protein